MSANTDVAAAARIIEGCRALANNRLIDSFGLTDTRTFRHIDELDPEGAIYTAGLNAVTTAILGLMASGDPDAIGTFDAKTIKNREMAELQDMLEKAHELRQQSIAANQAKMKAAGLDPDSLANKAQAIPVTNPNPTVAPAPVDNRNDWGAFE